MSRLTPLSAHSSALIECDALRKCVNIVSNIVDGLCKRDSRFQYIQASVIAFRDEEQRFASALRDMTGLDIKDPSGDGTTNTDQRVDWPCTQPNNRSSLPLETMKEQIGQLAWILTEIADEAIYEALDAFGISIRKDQVPRRTQFPAHIELLQDLYGQSKLLPLRQVDCISLRKLPSQAQEGYVYQYSESLIPLSKGSSGKKVRVLHISPGSGQSRIDCQLEVCDLDVDGINEALSYVWGKSDGRKAVWIDGHLFLVTQNLYEILEYLRDPHVTRTIWIDAICINQSDPEEKAHQVRLMGEIYSTAKRTLIWLSGRTPDPPHTNDPTDILAPLPPRFREHFGNQYDLVSILGSIGKLTPFTKTGKEQVIVSLLLAHCVNAIISHEWWERVWTTQEAVLPRQHPQFLFRGYGFSFGDFVTAIDAIDSLMDAISKLKEEDIRLGETEDEFKFLKSAHILQMAYWRSFREAHLLTRLRPRDENRREEGWLRGDLHSLLCATSEYKAADPRDKYFALQSLLPNSKGQLVYVDYTKCEAEIFKRATARCYNTGSKPLSMTTTFKLLVETQATTHRRAECNKCGASWVQDFTYSDARHIDSSHNRKMTFMRYLGRRENWQPEYLNTKFIHSIRFATPSTLFVSGVGIDVICATGCIPYLGDDDFCGEQFFTFSKHVLIQQYHDWVEQLRNDKLGGFMDTSSIIEYVAAYLQNKLTKSKSQTSFQFDDMVAELGESVPGGEQILRFYLYRFMLIRDFLTLGWSGKFELDFTTGRSRWQSRLREVSGRPYFTTDKNLVGIATAPVKEGDILAIFHTSPAYFILREVEGSDGHSCTTKRHRIVARAILGESQDTMKERVIEGLESCVFEIV